MEQFLLLFLGEIAAVQLLFNLLQFLFQGLPLGQFGELLAQGTHGVIDDALDGAQLDDGVVQLIFAGFQLGHLLIDHVAQLVHGGVVRQEFVQLRNLQRAHGAADGVGELVFRVVQLRFRRIQLFVDGVGQLLIQHIDFILADDHMQFLLDDAAGGDPGHATDALQLGHEHILHEIRQLIHIHVLHGHGADLHGNHGRVDLQHIGGAHSVLPARLQNTDFLLDVHADGIQVHIVLKFQHDQGIVGAGVGDDIFYVLQGGHRLLHGLGDGLLHGLRTGTGIGGHDDHIGEVHAGQQIRGHPGISNDAQNQNGHGGTEDRQRFFDAEFRHGKGSFLQKYAKNSGKKREYALNFSLSQMFFQYNGQTVNFSAGGQENCGFLVNSY